MSNRFIIAVSLLFASCVGSLLWAVVETRKPAPRTWRPSIHVTDGTWGDCYDYVCRWPQTSDPCGKHEICEPRTCRSGGPTIWIDGVPYPEPKTWTPEPLR